MKSCLSSSLLNFGNLFWVLVYFMLVTMLNFAVKTKPPTCQHFHSRKANTRKRKHLLSDFLNLRQSINRSNIVEKQSLKYTSGR